MQSHGGQVRRLHDHSSSSDVLTDAISPARWARRRLLKSVLFGPGNGHDELPPVQSGNLLNSEVTHAVIGTVLDVSPHVLVLQTAAGEERLTLAASTRRLARRCRPAGRAEARR